MSARYEITGDDTQALINGRDISACSNREVRAAIRQQSDDIAALQQVISDQILVIEDLDYRRGKVCDENDQLRAELAAVVGERDMALDKVSVVIGRCWCNRATLHAELMP